MSTGTLRKNSASFWHVLAQGLMANGPLGSATTALTAAAAFGLGSLPLAYLAGIVIVFLWINTPYQFSLRLSSASGMYYFVAKGVGTEAGYMAGISYALYYLFLIPANSLFFGILVPFLLGLFGVALPSWFWLPLAIVFLIPVYLLNIKGIKLSLNYGIVTVLIELVILLVVSVVIISRAGDHNTLSVFTPHFASGGLSGFGIAMLVAAFGMSGSTAVVYLGEEAEAPAKTIKRALIIGTAIVAAMYILVSYAFTIGWGPLHMGAFAAANIPGLIVIHNYLGLGPEVVIGLLALNSVIGINVASTIVVSRLLYSFGKAGLMPQALAKVDAKSGTPVNAILVLTLASLLLIVVVGLWQGPGAGFIFLLLGATMAEFIAHLIGNAGLMSFYKKLGKFGFVRHGLLPTLSILTILVGLWTTFVPPAFPVWIAAVISILGAVIGLWQVRSIRARNAQRAASIDASLATIGQDGGA
ncbi:MAG: APC family permease [Thermaerobacter sp.]|nr:APC family permease [Thermaerobacter sp.]